MYLWPKAGKHFLRLRSGRKCGSVHIMLWVCPSRNCKGSSAEDIWPLPLPPHRYGFTPQLEPKCTYSLFITFGFQPRKGAPAYFKYTCFPAYCLCRPLFFLFRSLRLSCSLTHEPSPKCCSVFPLQHAEGFLSSCSHHQPCYSGCLLPFLWPPHALAWQPCAGA